MNKKIPKKKPRQRNVDNLDKQAERQRAERLEAERYAKLEKERRK